MGPTGTRGYSQRSTLTQIGSLPGSVLLTSFRSMYDWMFHTPARSTGAGGQRVGKATAASLARGRAVMAAEYEGVLITDAAGCSLQDMEGIGEVDLELKFGLLIFCLNGYEFPRELNLFLLL